MDRDKNRIKEIIDSDPNFIYDMEIFLYILCSDMNIIKYIFEYSEKINKKININKCVTFSTEMFEYKNYLKKHNYVFKKCTYVKKISYVFTD